MSRILCPKCGEDVDTIDPADDFDVGAEPLVASGGRILSMSKYSVGTMTMLPCECSIYQIKKRGGRDE